MKYEILIANERPEKHQFDEGDIVAIRPHPWNWGAKEIDQYFIVIVDTDLSLAEMQNFTVRNFFGVSTKEQESSVFETVGIPISKRRYQIKLTDIKSRIISDLDLAKVRDVSVKYQPFKAEAKLVQKFDGIKGNHLIDAKDVDCASLFVSKDAETAVNLLVENIIFDKQDGKLVSAKKTATVIKRG